jgi:alcohol dehydrogenase class IV
MISKSSREVELAADKVFRSAGYPWKLFCGPLVIEADLASAVRRQGASRAFVICSPSINSKTDIVDRIKAALGTLYCGCFDGVENDSTYLSVVAAAEAAKVAGADLLIAVGGGSVIVAVRGVAVFMGETADPFDLMTQYSDSQKPFSPRLEASKLPIINIPTTPTSAMNRAGSGLKNPDLDHRMEYFDPKTRPASIFLDQGALMSAPLGVVRSTATTLFAGLFATLGEQMVNPLVRGDLDQAFKLAFPAYRSLMSEPENPSLRCDLALAAFLQNRAEDDGRPMRARGPFASDYAVATALHLQFPTIGQGEATSVLHASTIRLFPEPPPLHEGMATIKALGISEEARDPLSISLAIADGLEELYAGVGMPTRLRDLPVKKSDIAAIAAETVNNFNASASLTSSEERVANSRAILEAAW